MLVLYLGHSPLYRHFYKCLYIEVLKISHVYKLFHTFYTHVIFGCTRHSSNKFSSALVGTKIHRSTILEKA